MRRLSVEKPPERTGAAPLIPGQGRTAQSVEADALTFGVCAAMGTLLLGLAFLLPGCWLHVVDGMPVIKGDKANTMERDGG